MEFGIFYELQLPEPRGPRSARDLCRNGLAQLERADRLAGDAAAQAAEVRKPGHRPEHPADQAGKNSHADSRGSLELFAREVMPEFQGREPARQGWKRGVLAGEIDTAPCRGRFGPDAVQISRTAAAE